MALSPVPAFDPIVANLQATWTGSQLFLWSRVGTVDDALAELPGLPRPADATIRTKDRGSDPVRVKRVTRMVAVRRTRTLRATADGVELSIGDALPALCGLPTDAPVSDSVRCFSLAAKLALELAAAKRVVPTVIDGHARWIGVLGRPEDRSRFEALVRAIPDVGRNPMSETGRGALAPARVTARTFLDGVVDHLYRGGAYAGPARGWALDFAQALRGDESRFAVRDARAQATPDRITAWASRAEAPIPRVGFALDLPENSSSAGEPEDGRFPLRVLLHRPGDPRTSATIEQSWSAGKSLKLGPDELFHPAEAMVRGLARAARLYPPLAECLAGPRPRDLRLDASAAWAFLDSGRSALEDGGFSVLLPPAFERAGRQRIRTRIRLGLGGGMLDLAQLLTYRWEVLIGDQVLDGEEFSALCAMNRPIVRWQGDWVFLDPDELSRLPDDLSEVGTMNAPEALRAVLTGEHEGVPVVADEHLSLVLQALRDPPDLPPPPGLEAVLRTYQSRGYAWLTALGALGLGALLADDMGLGKTIQLIAYLLGRQRSHVGPGNPPRPSLVVCPTSVLGNWQREIAKFAPSLRVVRWHGLDRENAELRNAHVVLTTYGLLVRDCNVLCEFEWDVVALDEAQCIKNPDSRRARVARRVQARHRVALTGTPVENRLDELWSVMEYLVPGLLGSRVTFQRAVAVPIERFGDPDAANVLKRTVAPFMLRRSKSDPNIAEDLPDKLERREYCLLTDEQRRLYQAEVDAAMEEISGASDIERRGRVLAMLTALKQICNHPYHFLRRREPDSDGSLPGRSGKLDRITELVEEISSCGERAVLFTQYREMGDLLQAHLQSVLQEQIPFLHGGTSAQGRDAMVRQFQAGADNATGMDVGPTVLIVSLKAGGTGLSLTQATHVIHYDRWWNPAVEDQATDRAHRIGQHRTVVVHKLVCEGTLEERIDALLDQKRELFDAVVGTGEGWVTELDDDALMRLVLLSPTSSHTQEAP